jgi:hypothetical protein
MNTATTLTLLIGVEDSAPWSHISKTTKPKSPQLFLADDFRFIPKFYGRHVICTFSTCVNLNRGFRIHAIDYEFLVPSTGEASSKPSFPVRPSRGPAFPVTFRLTSRPPIYTGIPHPHLHGDHRASARQITPLDKQRPAVRFSACC